MVLDDNEAGDAKGMTYEEPDGSWLLTWVSVQIRVWVSSIDIKKPWCVSFLALCG